MKLRGLRRLRRLRLGVLGLVMVAGLSALAACGGGTDATVTIDALQAAATNTQQAESRAYAFTLSAAAGDEKLSVRGTAVTAGDGSRGKLSFEVPGEGSIEAIVVDHDVYVSIDGLRGLGGLLNLPGGASWIKIDLDELGEYFGTSGAVGGSVNPADQGLAALEGLVGDVEKVGDDTVAGEHATHYRAQVDYGKLAATLPDAKVADRLRELGTVPVDVWVDDHDRVVKLRVAMQGALPGTAGAGTMELTMEVTGFGVPVDVQAPPANQVVDLSGLLGGVLGGSAGKIPVI